MLRGEDEEKYFLDSKSFLEDVGIEFNKDSLSVSILPLHDLPTSTVPEFRLYRNDFYEITIAKNHQHAEVAVDGSIYRPNEDPVMLFIAPSQLQSFSVSEPTEQAYGFAIYISKQAMRALEQQLGNLSFFRRESQSYYSLTTEVFDTLTKWCELMVTASSESGKQADALMRSYLTIFLVHSIKLIAVKENNLVSKPEQVVQSFSDLLAADKKHLPAQHYADQLALTVKQLNTVLRKVLNKTASQAIQDATVSKAKGLLLQSNKTISEVAYDLGFEELSNFSRLFKRVTGQSPKRFMASGQN